MEVASNGQGEGKRIGFGWGEAMKRTRSMGQAAGAQGIALGIDRLLLPNDWAIAQAPNAIAPTPSTLGTKFETCPYCT
ncbi:MAG: hypothetical protein EA001_08595 [Oscillatoriales cyanobacterium]|nr:MAG: hypothetical protein EA001_08595 [Oscillatoriales cyanobacterium]